MSQMAIRVKDVAKRYRIGQREGYHLLRDKIADSIRALPRRLSNGHVAGTSRDQTIWALDGVSFDIEAGEVVGIIGRNGAGKTTLLKILSRITAPTRGEFEFHGQVGALLEVGTGFHGELTGRENIYLSGALLGMKKAEIHRKFDAIVDFADVEKFLDTPVKRYSAGMYMRLAFSVAAHLEPEILLVDEVLAVGDVRFQRKCLSKMEDLGHAGRTVLFVSHNTPSVLRLCDRVILLDQGVVVADGESQEVMARYLHSGSGKAGERTWTDVETAPGDSLARMRAVRVLDVAGAIAGSVDVGDPVLVEIEYWTLRPSVRPMAAFQFFNEEGTCLFASSAFEGMAKLEPSDGMSLVRARCTIPPHLLAEGRIFVQGAVVEYNPHVVHALERDAVSFQVVDRRAADQVREHHGGRWPGIVRPKLEWTIDSERWR